MGKFYLHLGPGLASIRYHNLRIFQNLFWVLGNHKRAKLVYVIIKKSFLGDLVKTLFVCTLSDTIQKCKISFIGQPMLLTFSRVTAASSFSFPKLLIFVLLMTTWFFILVNDQNRFSIYCKACFLLYLNKDLFWDPQIW